MRLRDNRERGQLLDSRQVRLERPASDALQLQLAKQGHALAPALDGLLLDPERLRERGFGLEMSDCVFLQHAGNAKAYLTDKSTGMPDRVACTIAHVSSTKTKPATKIGRRKRVATAAPKAQAEPEPDKRTIGGRLVICRKAAKWNQRQAAKKIGITPQSLGDLEAGKSKMPSAAHLLDMRDKAGWDPDYVIKGKGMPLLPNFEELVNEMTLISIFRELRPKTRESLLGIAQSLRRAQGEGAQPERPIPERRPQDR